MPPAPTYPGVYVEELPANPHTIQGVPTSITAFLGRTIKGQPSQPIPIHSFAQFEEQFGGLFSQSPMTYAVQDFFANGGSQAIIVRLLAPDPNADTPLSAPDIIGDRLQQTGLYALEKCDLFNLLCIPPDTRDGASTPAEVYAAAMRYCVERRAMLLVDPAADADAATLAGASPLAGESTRNVAVYFPWIKKPDPLDQNHVARFSPSGAVAGVIARTDAQRGVWKAPAGTSAVLNGIQELDVRLTDHQAGILNTAGINCLRTFPILGNVIWGARTLRGSESLADEYKYIPIRRLALYIEESLARGTQWAQFEPIDEPLWAILRQTVGRFMHNLFLQGAFQGTTAHEAYLVKCDADTTTEPDRAAGIVNFIVGFAPLRPAEFLIMRIQQRSIERPT